MNFSKSLSRIKIPSRHGRLSLPVCRGYSQTLQLKKKRRHLHHLFSLLSVGGSAKRTLYSTTKTDSSTSALFALSNKWLNLHKPRSSDLRDLAGPTRIPETLSYYKTQADQRPSSSSGKLDRTLLRELLTKTNESNTPQHHMKIKVGSLVECMPRHGQSPYPSFGVVIDVLPAKNRIVVYTLDATILQFPCDQVRFQLNNSSSSSEGSPIFNPALLARAFVDTSDPHIQAHVLALLRLIVKSSMEMLNNIQDSLTVVYAQSAAASSGIGIPQLFTVEAIADRALSVARLRRASKTAGTANSLTRVSSVLATHVWLSNNPIYWWQLPGDSTDGWLPYSASAAEDSQYVVAELENEDYSEFGYYLHNRLTNPITVINSTAEDDETNFSALIGFLKRYVVYPHISFEPAIITILSSAYPHTSISGDPVQVHKLLIDARLVTTENPILDADVIFSVSPASNMAVVDKYTPAAVALAAITSDNHYNHHHHHSSNTTSTNPYSGHTPFPANIPVYSFSSHHHHHHHHQQTPELAVSLDRTKPNSWKLHVHIPDLSAHYDPKSKLMAMALRRIRTASFPEGCRQLLPDNAVNLATASFRQNDGENSTSTKCITFTIKFSPWKPTEWGMNDIQVSLTEILNTTVLPIEQIEPLTGWTRYNSGAKPTRLRSTSDNASNVLDTFFSEEPEDSGRHLEPFESLELGGDLSNNALFDFHDSALGSGGDARHGLPQMSLHDHEDEIHQRLSVFSNKLSRTDRNNLAVIQELLLKNFWKRMDSGAVYHCEGEASSNTATSTSSLASIHLAQSSNTHEQHVESLDLNQRAPIVQRLITEAEILAGEICALFGAKVDLALPYEQQTLRSSGNHETDSVLRAAIEQTRGLDGTLSVSGRYLASRQYLGPAQTVLSGRHPHFGLGIGAGYVGVARPFDDIRHILVQWQLAARLNRIGQYKCGWSTLGEADLQSLLQSSVTPGAEVIQQVEGISKRYWTLRWLEQELKRSAGYFVFKCIIGSEVAEYPDLATGFCVELGMDVKIAMTSSTPSVRVGDRVMCTGILTLDATTGVLILGL